MAGIYKVVVGRDNLLEINKRMNDSKEIFFKGAFAHTDAFDAELIYVQNRGEGRFFESYILTMKKDAFFMTDNGAGRNDVYFDYSDLRQKVYENFRTGKYHNLFKRDRR